MEQFSISHLLRGKWQWLGKSGEANGVKLKGPGLNPSVNVGH